MSPLSQPLARPLRAAAAALALVLSLLLLTACGEDEKTAVTTSPAALAPADAIAYGEVIVQPSGEVGAGVRTALQRIVRVEDPGAELRRALDEETASGERGGYSRWVEPWLGETVSAFAIDGGAGEDPDWATLIAADDRDEAERVLNESVEDGDLKRGGEVEGVGYWRDARDPLVVGLVEQYVVVGSMEGFSAAVRASKGRSLADDPGFEQAAERVPDDRLAWGYLDGRALVERLGQSDVAGDPEVAEALDGLKLDRVGNAVVSLALRVDEVVLEIEGDGVEDVVGDDGDAGLGVADLPGDAWLALASPLMRSQIRAALDGAGGYASALGEIRAMTGLDVERDLLSWISGLGVFLRGTSPLDLGAGVVAGSRDDAASERFVARVERLAGSLGLATTPVVGGGTGFQVRLPDFPQPLVVLARDDRVAIAIGLASARDGVDPPQPFGEEEPGRTAIASLGDGYRAAFVLTVDPLVSLLTNLGLASDPDFRSALPYLSAYRAVAAGTRQEDGRTAFKLVIGLHEPDEDDGE